MAIYDRWHLSHPAEGAEPCKCGRGRNKLYPTAVHGKGKRWQVRWDLVDEEGKRHQPKRNFDERYGTDPERCAEAWDAKVNADIDADTYIDPAAGKVTLESYAKGWRASLTTDPATLQQLDSRLRKWVYGTPTGTQEMRILAKRPTLMQAWIKGMEAHLEPATIKTIVSWVSTIFEVAVIDGVVHRNPMRTGAVKPPRVTPKRVVPWTLAQATAARGDLLGRYRALVDVGIGEALRQGELFGLAKDDVELMLHVRRQVKLIGGRPCFAPPKGGKLRDVPISGHVRRKIKEHMKTYPPVEVTLPWLDPASDKTVTVELIFTNCDGRAIHRDHFNEDHWAGARRAAGVPETRANGMHVLRHTAASAWLAEGVDINAVAEWLGHSDPGFTLRTYTHLMPSAADRARAAMDAFFEPDEGESDGRSAPDVPSEGAG